MSRRVLGLLPAPEDVHFASHARRSAARRLGASGSPGGSPLGLKPPAQRAAFDAFVELLIAEPQKMAHLAQDALTRAQQRAGTGDTPTLPSNFARALRTEPYGVAREREQLEALIAALADERASVEADRAKAAHEAAVVRRERADLERAKADFERSQPEAAAARIQARVRALRTRIEYIRALSVRELDRERNERQRVAERQARRAARRDRDVQRQQDKAVHEIQRVGRGFLARRQMEVRRLAVTAAATRKRAEAAAVRAEVHARLGAMRNRSAAAALQAALRGFGVRRGVPNVVRLRAQAAARRQVDAHLARSRAVLVLQRIARGRRGRKRADAARQRAEAERVQRRRRQQTVATRAALDTKMQLRALAATLRVQAAARGRLARRAASLSRHEAAEASHAARVAVRERLRLRGAVLTLQRAARAYSARGRLAERRAAVAEKQLGAAYREEALLDRLRHAESSSAPKVQSTDHAMAEAAAPAHAPPLSKRGHNQRRRAALRLQAAARGSWARAQFARALEVRRTDEARMRQEKALVSAARQERRRERERLTAAAVRVQSTIRAHWGRLEAALRRDERDFSKLRSLAVAAQRAAPSPAAATGRQQPATVGQQPATARHNGSKSSAAVAASPRATQPPSSSRLAITVHSAVLSEALHRHPRVQLAWVVVEIAGGRLLSAATRRLPLPAVGEPLRFDAPPATLELRSGPLAAELVALLRSGAEADNESDVVFSLFGASVNDPPQAALYLGEAYVNLHEQVAARVDVDASTPLTLLGSNAQGDDVAIGSLYVTVSVGALGALLRRDSPNKALDERFLERDFHYDD